MTKKQLLENYIRENIDQMYRFAYSYMMNQSDAEDVMNDSVVKALKAIDTLINPEYLGTWLHKIIANTALSYLDRRKKIVYMDSNDLFEIPANEQPPKEVDFEYMIYNLAPKYKSIIVLRFLEDRSIEDIAQILEENVNTIKTRLYKALRLLRIDMEGKI